MQVPSAAPIAGSPGDLRLLRRMRVSLIRQGSPLARLRPLLLANPKSEAWLDPLRKLIPNDSPLRVGIIPPAYAVGLAVPAESTLLVKKAY